MIVLDASAVVEILTNSDLGRDLRAHLAMVEDQLAVPHLLDVEVLSALRGMVAGGRLERGRSDEFLLQLALLPAERYAHIPLMPRIWELRNHFSAYDAAYIALAEQLNATLYTADRRLGKGHRAKVVVFSGNPGRER